MQQSSFSQDQRQAEHQLSNYRLGRTLGVGSFGKVKLAEHVLTTLKVAIKILNKRKVQQMDMEEKVRREIKILSMFMHPHIIRLYEVIETNQDIFVVMEYVKQGELFDYIVEKGRLFEEEARHFFQQIVSGVEYCHRNMVAHRDLKPENLLLDSKMGVKIADFGLSNVMKDGHFLKTSCGSPNYAAPEVISGKLYAGPEIDVWSFGVILYALLCGSLPFDDENIPNLFKKIKQGVYSVPNYLPKQARNLIQRMLEVDPLKRITIPEIRNHDWFQQHLPRYLALHADPTYNQTKIDDDIVIDTVNLGFDRDKLIEGIKAKEHTRMTVTYFLLLDNKKLNQAGYLQDQLTESNKPYGQNVLSQNVNAPYKQLSASVSEDQQVQRLRADRNYKLGFVSRNTPLTIMNELLKTLQMLGIKWKKMVTASVFTIKCIKILNIQPSQQRISKGKADMSSQYKYSSQSLQRMTSANKNQSSGKQESVTMKDTPQIWTKEVKFEVSVFKYKDQEYLVDVQRLEGDHYIFFDICTKIFTFYNTAQKKI